MRDNIIPTAAVVLINKDRVLLVKHGEEAGHITGVYGLPGGRILEGESEIHTAIRELKEETGLAVDQNNLVKIPKEWQAVIERKDGFKTFSLHVFTAISFTGVLQATHETAPEWIELKQLAGYTLLPNTREAIEEVINTSILSN